MEKLILLYLYSNPGSKARSIADNILATRSDVNSCLYSNRLGWWYQGGEYRYFLTQKGVNAVRAFIAQTVKEKPKASKQRRPWTLEEDEQLKEMLANRVGIDELVSAIGHNIDDVEARMKELGVEYPEESPSAPADPTPEEPPTQETPTIDETPEDPTPQPLVQQDDSKYNESLVEIVEDAVEKEKNNYLIIARDCVKQISKRVSRSNHDQIYEQSEHKYVYWVLENPIKNPLQGTDRFVYRNSDIGRRLQETPLSGNYELRVRGMGKDAHSFYIHKGHVFNTLDYKRHAISIEGISGQQRFSDLSLLLRKLDEQAEHGGEAPEMSGIEMLKAFIHESAQLGFTPLMSPEQAKVKYNNLFKSCVIVDGGPGTGKTTTMVSRLKFLTDKYELENDISQDGETYAPLNKAQKKKLLDLIQRHRDWFFFTPSKLLRQYMDSAMRREGLENTGSKVKYWNDFCSEYLKDMDLFDTSKPNPRFRSLDTNEEILIYDAKAVIDDFTQYFINYCLDVVKRYPMSGMSAALTNRAESIKSKITNANNPSLEGLIRLFKQIKREDEEYSIRMLGDLKNRIDSIMWDLYEAMSKDEDAMDYIREAIKKNKNNDEDNDENEDDDEEQDEANSREEDKRIRMFIRSLIKPYAMWVIRNKKPGKSKQPHIDYFEDYLDEIDRSNLETISKIASYEPFAKLASGVTTNVLRDISRVYKKYRDDVICRRDASWNINLLQEIVSESKRNLHIQEQALLIGFLNTLYRKAPTIDHDTTSNNNVQVFLDYERPIIGVDEATDFSPIEIYAMTSFAMPEYYSITLDGDIMQRITGRGLQSWDDLNGIINEPQLFPLTVSFRQSSKMLKIAQQLYKDTTGKDPNYTADMKLQSVPDALAYVSNSETAKLEWIEERISQIYDIYGDRLPSIAIFLNDHEQTFNFARKLNAHDFFRDHNIKVIVGSEGETLAKVNQVRVFSIDKVKGMEFDVVFFHDVDQSPYSEDLIKRYIYIGVSRAAFFLGVTMKQRNEDLLKYFNEKANWAFIE